MLAANAGAPLPTFRGPEFASSIAGVFHELSEFSIGHRSFRDCKRGDFNLVCPLFIIKDKAFSGAASEHEPAAWDLRVACQVIAGLSESRVSFHRPHSFNYRDVVNLNVRNANCRRTIAESLSRVSDRFVVHLLVEEALVAGRIRPFALLALAEEPQRCQRSLDSFGASDESALDADCVGCQGKADGGDAGVRALARVIRHHAIGTIGLFQKIAKGVALEFVQRCLAHRRLTDHQSPPVIISARTLT